MTTPISGTLPPGTITTDAPTAGKTTTAADQSTLSSQSFLQLLVAQLQYQDPSSPTDTATLMNETATLNQIQTMQQLSAASTAQTAAQQQQTATNIVGHNVTYTTSAGTTATGFVSAATLTGTSPTLQIDGGDVALANIQQVLANTTSSTGTAG
jgi:flagellar basal-body rod modification protein FlgD